MAAGPPFSPKRSSGKNGYGGKAGLAKGSANAAKMRSVHSCGNAHCTRASFLLRVYLPELLPDQERVPLTSPLPPRGPWGGHCLRWSWPPQAARERAEPQRDVAEEQSIYS